MTNRDKSSTKYVGMDVHRDCIAMAVLNQEGRQVGEHIVPTDGAAVLEFIQGLRGTVQVTLEETTQSAWLYDLLQRHVSKIVVSNPRKNALLKAGNTNDKLAARQLAELLRAGMLSPVYHGQNSARELQELGRAYTVLTEDSTRVMARLKAIYRGQALGTAGKGLYSRRRREEWLQLLRKEHGLRQRAEYLFQQMDSLRAIRKQARQSLLAESRKFQAVDLLRSVPFLGPIRAALLVGKVQTPFRFRTKRQFWSYCGLGLETRSSADYRIVAGQIRRNPKPVLITGLNFHHSHELKNIFKAAATTACVRSGPFHDYYQGLIAKGMQPAMARLTLARKIATIALTLWKKGERFDPTELQSQAA
jgi:transposase